MDEVCVAAKLESVPSVDDADVIREFEAPFDAIHWRVGFAAEIGTVRDVDADQVAAGKLREAEVETATRDLRAEFIEGCVADNGVMLESEIEVARLVVAGARAGVLTEDLVLRSGRQAGDKRWGNTNAKEGVVMIVPAMIDARGPKAGLFLERLVSTNGFQCHIMEMTVGRSRQRYETDVVGAAYHAIHLWSATWTCDRAGKERSWAGVIGWEWKSERRRDWKPIPIYVLVNVPIDCHVGRCSCGQSCSLDIPGRWT